MRKTEKKLLIQRSRETEISHIYTVLSQYCGKVKVGSPFFNAQKLHYRTSGIYLCNKCGLFRAGY